jgi:heme/copper-type cytochrome/quinol oxidase subunit 2
MKYKILGFLVVVLFVGALLSYHESVVLMRGDYLLTKWMGVTETNKNWFMLFFWLIVGVCTPYIIVKLNRRRKEKKNGKKVV